MGHLSKFTCRNCGKSIMAPNNESGRYCIMSGTYQYFFDRENNRLGSARISRKYLHDNESFDQVASKAIAELLKDEGDRYVPWNAITGKCPCCGGDLELDRHDFGVFLD